MKKLFALAVVLGLLFVGDSAARAYAGSELEAQLVSSLHLKGRPEVTIDGFPFIVRLVQGEFEEVRISAEGVESNEIELSESDITLKDVAFSPSKAVTGNLRAIRFSTAHGSALITSSALEAAVDRVPLDFTLPRIDPNDVRLDQNALELGPVHLELPVIAEGMEYEAAHVVDGGLHLIFSLNGDKVRL